MEIRYKLLSTGAGVILDRRAEFLRGDLRLEFGIFGQGAVAVIANGKGEEFYRELEDGIATIESDKLIGEVKVSVVISESGTPAKKWVCEELYGERVYDGIVICPNDRNLPEEFTTLRLECEMLRESFALLKKKVQELEEKLEAIKEGHDYI